MQMSCKRLFIKLRSLALSTYNSFDWLRVGKDFALISVYNFCQVEILNERDKV